jgi:hypothetical protein
MMKKTEPIILITYAIGWGLYATGASLWINAIVANVYPDPWLSCIIVPIYEEITKFIGYRAVKKYSVAIPITFMVLETLTQPHATLVRFLTNISALKHVGFWSVGSITDFKWLSLPLMILCHAAWNYWAISDGAGEALGAFVILLTVFCFGAVLWKNRS